MYVAKDLPQEEKSKEQLEGTAVHEALKRRIKLREKLPEEYSNFEDICAEISTTDHIKYCEMKLGVHHDNGPCDFFLSGVFLRGVLDLVLSYREGNSDAGWSCAALLLDWKTGKKREDPFELEIQALLLKKKWPELAKITGHYVWLRDNGGKGALGAAHDCSDTEKTLAKVKATEASMKARLVSKDWPPDDGPLCAWCPVTSCEHWRERPR
jgi:hypothetical protein